MNIEMVESTHTYLVDGDIASISVTELLAKHGLAPDYSGVNKRVLKASAKRGTAIHKELENIVNDGKYKPTTPEGENFLAWYKANVKSAVAEQKLALEYNGMIICGTADLIGELKDGTYFIADHKTTSQIHEESVTWQCSLLNLMNKLIDGKVNGEELKYKGAGKMFCLHYTGDKMVAKELTPISDEELTKLVLAEYNGKLYQRPTLSVGATLQQQIELVERNIALADSYKKSLEEQAKVLRGQLIKAMEEQGIKSWETEKIKVSYIPQLERLSVDSSKLKTDFPQVYEKCLKLTKVKPTVRIKIKGEE